MNRKLLSLLLIFILIFAICGCKKSTEPPSGSSSDGSADLTQVYINSLTGEEISEQKALLRPVAVVINNLNAAQRVQTGVTGADIVYETEVEGGITRLLAVYKDISSVKELGSIRSARVVFAELAESHSAIFVHHGIDPNYAADYVKKHNTDFDTNKKNTSYSFRKNNGLGREHTVYSSPDRLLKGFEKNNIEYRTQTNTPWCDFSLSERVPDMGTANSISIKFSSSYISNFDFDAATALYTKNSARVNNKDYVTGQPYSFKNVFLLQTKINDYPDGVHRKIELLSGEGYYFSLGAYEKISWKKQEGQPIKFYTAQGSELKVNKGNSWVCINSGQEPQIE